MRQIEVYPIDGGEPMTINSEATLWGDLQEHLLENNINFNTDNVKAVIGETKITLEATEAVLPEGDFTLMLFQKETKLGVDNKGSHISDHIDISKLSKMSRKQLLVKLGSLKKLGVKDIPTDISNKTTIWIKNKIKNAINSYKINAVTNKDNLMEELTKPVENKNVLLKDLVDLEDRLSVLESNISAMRSSYLLLVNKLKSLKFIENTQQDKNFKLRNKLKLQIKGLK